MAEKIKNNSYEAMFLFPATVAADLDHALMTSRQIIERHDGKVTVLKKWDERKLAYEIDKNKRGVYIIAYFTGPGAIVTAIERDVNLSEEVLRVMVTKADHLNQSEMDSVEPQPIQQRVERTESWDRPPRDDRGPREDRGDRGDRAPRPRREENTEESIPQA
ncbi:MAG TPA: 30S ribosomal protein S6 [Tepidisphaeraceae bacterium]|jgi:small subunit ribosomal protein S6